MRVDLTLFCTILVILRLQNEVFGMGHITDSKPTSPRQKVRSASRELGLVIAASCIVTGSQRIRLAAASTPEITGGAGVPNTEPAFLSSFTSGAVSRASKEILLHPIDTVRARLQARESDKNHNNSGLYDNLYDGVLPALASGVPAGAIFFAVKDSSTKYLRNRGSSKKVATLASVAAANVPYWVVRNPSEVLKTRQQVSSIPGSVSLIDFLQVTPVHDWYRGYLSNIGYAYPADAIKFLVYEIILDEVLEGKKTKGLQAAIAGASAGLVAQVTTTPLDVIRTRVMVSQNNAGVVLTDTFCNGTLFKGVCPRALRAVGSGAIQFASYELTQNAFQK